ncbi:MAG: IPT/TIG domain-containing protein [Planctomycetota bacterium]
MGNVARLVLLLAVLLALPFTGGCGKIIVWVQDTSEEVTKEDPPPPEPDPPPQILFIFPMHYDITGGQTVNIRGFDFQANSMIYIDGVPCTNVTFTSSILISGDVPAHAVGTADVTVINPDGYSDTAPDAIVYTTGPVIRGLIPDQGTEAGGTNVNVSGFNFQTGLTLTFGANPGVNVTVVSPNSITCQSPPGPLGSVPVTVTNPDTQSFTFNYFLYTLAAPDIVSINPLQGTNMGGNTVTIDGAYFQPGCAVLFGTVQSPVVTFVNANQVTAMVPAGPHAVGPVDVLLINPDSQQDIFQSYTYIFTSPPPSVTSISPDFGPSTGGTAVVITGANFQPGATVTIGAFPAQAAVASATQINGTTGIASSLGATTTLDVIVTNPDTQSGSLSPGFTYTVPAGNRVSSYQIDGSANCDLWHLDFAANIGLLQGDMVGVGLHTNGADPQTDSYAEDFLQGEILGFASQYYLRNFDGTKVPGTSFNICFVGVQPTTPWVPPPATTGPAQAFMYNIMHFGGTGIGGGVLGVAWVDSTSDAQGNPTNQRRENNSSANGNGVFTGAISAGGSLSPALSATDRQYLDGSYWLGKGTATQDARFTAIRNLMGQWGSRIAQVTQHECGHSLGMVITARNAGVTGAHCPVTNCPMYPVASWGNTAFCTGATSCTAELANALGYSP